MHLVCVSPSSFLKTLAAAVKRLLLVRNRLRAHVVRTFTNRHKMLRRRLRPHVIVPTTSCEKPHLFSCITMSYCPRAKGYYHATRRRSCQRSKSGAQARWRSMRQHFQSSGTAPGRRLLSTQRLCNWRCSSHRGVRHLSRQGNSSCCRSSSQWPTYRPASSRACNLLLAQPRRRLAQGTQKHCRGYPCYNNV